MTARPQFFIGEQARATERRNGKTTSGTVAPKQQQKRRVLESRQTAARGTLGPVAAVFHFVVYFERPFLVLRVFVFLSPFFFQAAMATLSTNSGSRVRVVSDPEHGISPHGLGRTAQYVTNISNFSLNISNFWVTSESENPLTVCSKEKLVIFDNRFQPRNPP